MCTRCVLADRPWTRLRGLLGRKGLDADEGVLLRPVGAIHTMFMRFPIDAVFLDREYAVVKVVENLRPWRFAGARGRYRRAIPSQGFAGTGRRRRPCT